MRPPNDEGSELSRFHCPCIKEKDELYILSLESVTSIQTSINVLKVVYHPVSCLLHHYVNQVNLLKLKLIMYQD